MKNKINLLGLIALVAVIGFSFAACDGEQGPQGQQGPQGGIGPAGSVKVVDNEGREVGTVVWHGVIEDKTNFVQPSDGSTRNVVYVVKNGYTFPIDMFFSGSIIATVYRYATEQFTGEHPTQHGYMSGKFYLSDYVSKDAPLFQNFIVSSGEGLYLAKNRDAQGYAIPESGTVSYQSYGGVSNYNLSGTLKVGAVEIESTGIYLVDIIGFTPTRPLRFQY
ncbi:MAG: hypothetical protein LBI28_01410 [Treponema sp.]|jgi:hypothetical protein|nr:hypothetical protein [Treponema sp.]